MLKTILVIAAFLIGTALLMWTASANAQSAMCGPYKEFVEAIEGSRYGESSIGKGISGSGTRVVELFVGKETFTILATWPDSGRTCIIAAGKMWIGVAPKINGEPL